MLQLVIARNNNKIIVFITLRIKLIFVKDNKLFNVARCAITFFVLCDFICKVRKDVEIEPILLFGNNLRLIRQSKNLSMEKLAELSSFEYSQISRIELGQINTSIDTVFKLAKALNIDAKELFDFE